MDSFLKVKLKKQAIMFTFIVSPTLFGLPKMIAYSNKGRSYSRKKFSGNFMIRKVSFINSFYLDLLPPLFLKEEGVGK